MEIVEQLFNKAFPGIQVTGKSISNYWIIPGPNLHPRWIVPKDSKLGYKVLSQWHPFNHLSRIKWYCFLTAYKLGKLTSLPNLYPIHLNTGALFPGSEPIFYIGTPSRVQKLVVILVEPSTGHPNSVIKIPIGEAAAGNIQNEANALNSLRLWKDRISPSLQQATLDSGRTQQEALQGNIAGFNLSQQHLQLLAKLRCTDQYTTLRKHIINLKLAAEAFELSPQEKFLFETVTDFLDEDVQLPSFYNHGDFSPWNVIKGKKGLSLIDWERAEPDGLPLIDLIHFLMMQRHILNKPPLLKIHTHPTIIKYLQQIQLDVTEITLKKLVLYYFTNSWINAHKEKLLGDKEIGFQSLQRYWTSII